MIPHSAPLIGAEERAAVDRVIASGHIAQGTEVAAFEEECAAALGRRYGIAVNSGTSALHLALLASGVRDGAPVAVPSYACAALITAVGLAGGEAAVCDIGSDYNLDVDTVPPGCPFAIVAHLLGAPSAVPQGPVIIEDVAQSMGGDTGRASAIAITSFYATKMITTGEGGMVFTDDEGLAAYVRERRDYDKRDDFETRFNYKMTDMQAAMGRVQLRRLPEFIARRRAIAAHYDAAFAELPLALPQGDGHVYSRYVVGTDQRAALEKHLHDEGVDAKGPVHRPAHHYLGGQCPQAEAAHEKALSMPVHPSLVDGDVARVIDSVRTFFD